MFPTLSFKKFQRRIRSPFTFFKKFGRKQKKTATHKRQASIQHVDTSRSLQDTPTPLTVNVKVPSTPDIPSSDSGVFFPPSAKSTSSESGLTSRAQAFDRPLPEIVDEDEVEPLTHVEISTFVPSEEKVVIADQPVEVEEELKADPVDIEGAVPVEKAPLAVVDVEVQPELATVADVPQNNGSLVDNVNTEEKDVAFPEHDEVAAKELEAAAALCTEPQFIKEFAQASEQDEVTVVGLSPLTSEDEATTEDQTPSPVNLEIIVTPPATEDKVTVTEEAAPLADAVPVTETSIEVIEPAVEPAVNENEENSEVNQLVDSPAVEDTIQELHIITTKEENTFTVQISPPETPRSASSQKFSPTASPRTPRKRVTSEGLTQKDKDIMDELQASVRSREKKRKEQERIQAAEKERKLRELSVKLEMLEKERVDSADKNEVLREVRSWRKQRESSLKTGCPEDATKDASYREAFANEEIMHELQSVVQTRLSRGPLVEDPAEKRQQLLLEEIYASRVQATKA